METMKITRVNEIGPKAIVDADAIMEVNEIVKDGEDEIDNEVLLRTKRLLMFQTTPLRVMGVPKPRKVLKKSSHSFLEKIWQENRTCHLRLRKMILAHVVLTDSVWSLLIHMQQF